MKKTTVKILSLVLASLIATGCSSKNETVKASSEETEKKVYKIGISQLIDHESLDAARKGFVDGLNELGYKDGDNLVIDYQNAQGAQANSQTIASQFVSDKKDLVLAISTPSAQSIANATKDIPILVTAVTNPQEAKLVKSNDNPETNVSGTSDMAPVDKQIELIKEIMPEIKTLGLLYSSSEDNSIYQIAIAKKACDELGIEYVEATVSGINDIQQVVTDLSGKVEAIYSPTDNVIASAMPNVNKIAMDSKIPTYTGWASEGDKGGMASLAIDYYQLGKITAKQADRVLKGEDISKMAIEYQQDCQVYINYDMADELKIEIPEKYKK